VIHEAFSVRIHLHRIQAAIRPDNRRSLALADRLGFADEGLARDYLFIAGAWRDHRLLALTNPGFVPPPGW
jgi:ribosomal-protein-alanine N-acetyltransferase